MATAASCVSHSSHGSLSGERPVPCNGAIQGSTNYFASGAERPILGFQAKHGVLGYSRECSCQSHSLLGLFLPSPPSSTLPPSSPKSAPLTHRLSAGSGAVALSHGCWGLQGATNSVYSTCATPELVVKTISNVKMATTTIKGDISLFLSYAEEGLPLTRFYSYST